MSTPCVSVLMSVYNGERHLEDAVESVLRQTFRNFELVIVDDGSTDSTPGILASFAARDDRVVLVRNDCNLGLTRSLNRGLALARGEYFARQDADDVSLPERLAYQVKLLDRRLEIGLVGTWTERIDGEGHSLGVRPMPTRPTHIRWQLIFANPFVHSSVMFRRSLLEAAGAYNESLKYAQDHELWVRYSYRALAANIPVPLVKFRRHDESISSREGKQQWAIHEETTQRNVERLMGKAISMEQIRSLPTLVLLSSTSLTVDQMKQSASFLVELRKAFRQYWRPSFIESLPVGLDSARRLVRLAARARVTDRATAMAMLRSAVLADPRIIATRPFLRCLGRSVWVGLPV